MSPFKRGSGSFHRGGSDTRCRAGDVSSRPQDGGDSVTLRFRNHLPALESRGLAGAALTHGNVVVVDAFDTGFVQREHISSILHVNGRSGFSQTSVNANSKKGLALHRRSSR